MLRHLRLPTLALLLPLSACSSSPELDEESGGSEDTGDELDYEIELVERPCSFDVPAERSAECYTLRLPLDRADPEQGSVELPVAVLHPPSGAAPRRDPLIYLHGGPGGYAVSRASSWLNRPLGEDGDVILFDQRGSGEASPKLDCPELEAAWYASFTATLAPEEEIEIMSEAVGACRERLAAETDLGAFDTPTIADDVDDLRRALDIERWHVYGASYGTRLGLEYMRRYGERVGAVVLDSAYPPTAGDVEWMERGVGDALPRVIEGCLAEASCAAQYPELAQNFLDAVASLDAEPYAVTAEDSQGVVHELRLTGADMVAGLYNAIYDPTVIPNVPLLIAVAGIGGNFDFLDLLAEQALPQLTRLDEGARLSIDCADAGRMVDATALADSVAAHPERATTYLGYAPPFCALWDVEPVAPEFNEPVVSDLPTLVIAGEYDPVTPPWQSEETVETLSAGELLLFPGQGHTPSFTNQCAATIVREFFVAEALGDLSCFEVEPQTTF